MWEAQVLGLCSPCSYIHSVAPNFVCFSAHTGRGVHIHCEIQAGSKAEPVINPPRGKHSSRYCGTFPAAYGRSSWAWECFLTAASPGESLVFEGFCCPLAFYIFTGMARSHMLIKQLLQNEGRPLAYFFLLQGERTWASQLISWIGVAQLLYYHSSYFNHFKSSKFGIILIK